MSLITRFSHRAAMVAVLVVCNGSVQAANTPIATWTFESPNTPSDLTGSMTSPTVLPDVGSGTASGLHANASTVWTTPVGNGSPESFSSNNWAVDDYWQFQTSTTGLDDIGLFWEQTGSNTGPKDFQVFWSTDNSTYTAAGSAYTLVNATWSGNPDNRQENISLYNLDLSSITALDNAANAYFRLVNMSTNSIAGGTVGGSGTSRVDNFSVVSDFLAPPPPPPRELPIAGDIVFGLNHNSGARTIELVRGDAVDEGGVQKGSPWFTTREIGSLEFDNKGGTLHNVQGNLLGIDEGTSPTNGGQIYNFATLGDPENLPAGVEIGNTVTGEDAIGQAGNLTTTRLSGLSVAPGNGKIAVAGMDSGRVVVYDYTAGNSLGGPSSGAALQNGRESAQVLVPSILDTDPVEPGNQGITYRYGTAWLDNDTVLTFNVSSPGSGQLISLDVSNNLASTVEENLSVPGIGGEHFTALAYNPDVSPYVYAMFAAFEPSSDPSSRNKLFILDPAADADPFNVLGERELAELDILNLTAKEIALDADGNLFIGAFASELFFIADVVTNPATIGAVEHWYSSPAFSFNSGLDIGFAPPDGGLDGDHNEDGSIDAADYVLWRKSPGQFGGDPGGYTTWRQNFGAGGAGSGGAVPEPACVTMVFVGLAALGCRNRRRSGCA